MKQLVVCSREFLFTFRKKIITSGSIDLKGKEVFFALIDFKEPVFDAKKQPNQVLVRKHAFSCNYRDITFIIQSSLCIEKGNPLSMFPIGSEFSGTVVEVGDHVTSVKAGDKVICDAFYPLKHESGALPGLPTNNASRELEIIHEKKLTVIPENMSAGVGAAFTVGAQTVYSMIDKLSIQSGDRVLINGIKSNTSLFAINALKNKDVLLCGTSRSAVDEQFFKNLGLSEIFYVGDEGFSENQAIQSYINENGKFNAVLDPFSDSYLLKSVDVMDFNSRYVTCGVSNQTELPTTEINLSIELAKIMTSNISIMGNCLGSSEDLKKALKDFSENKLKVVVDEEVDDVQQFMNRTFLSKDRLGKVVFKYSDF